MSIAWEQYQQSAEFLRTKLNRLPEICLVLGSGLGALAGQAEEAIVIPYEEIPGFPTSTVESHAGKLVCGCLGGKQVAIMAGRFHYYEGYDFETVSYYVRVMHLLGVKTLVITNAAGGINESFSVGDFMLITDQIQLSGLSPSRGRIPAEFGKRFFDMSHAYTPALQQVARNCAAKWNINLREGCYFYMSGPQFETPAEIRAIRLLGGDAVGMSTVAEVTAASQCGMQVLGLSFITNLAAGMIPDTEVSDDEVTANAAVGSKRFCTLVTEILAQIENN